MKLEDLIPKKIITQNAIQEGISSLAKILEEELPSYPLILIPVLTGGMYFAADLSRELNIMHKVWPISSSSYYGGTKALNSPKLMLDAFEDIEDYQLLIVDDILDTGKTIKALTNYLQMLNPKKITAVTLLKKKSSPETKTISVFEVPDKFVVGYGLDYQGYFRDISFIASIGEEICTNIMNM